MTLTGSQIILRVLRQKGVDTLFGYPGGAVIPFFDALYDELDYFHVYRPAHEQNGVHAADGYARTTGKLGVFIATSGPGATNTITGIANAYMDSVPLLVITGQVATPLIGKDSFQEIDITGVTLSVTKHNFLVRRIEDLQQIIEEAVEIAVTGRPGPVLVDVPKNILTGQYEYKETLDRPVPEQQSVFQNDLEEAAQLINQAKKPVIYAGGGVRSSGNDMLLTQFAEKGDIPVANSFMGLGSIPRDHRLSLGFVGMHGFVETNLAVTECDLLIAVGARFSDRVIGNPDKFAAGAKIIHIDIDGTEVDKNIPHCLPLIGDMREILTQLLEKTNQANHEDWLQYIRSLALPPEEKGFTPQYILETINRYYQKDTIVATDVGQHQMWTGQYWNFQHSADLVTSGGLGSMGFGLGASIGAQIGNPDKNVLLMIGDGGYRMSCQEMVTLSKYHLPVKVFMFNNSALGMVRQWQKMFSNARYSETDNNQDVDYVKLAQAYDIPAYRVTTLEELEQALKDMEGKRTAAFVECVIDKDCNVIPIVPPGNAIDEYRLN